MYIHDPILKMIFEAKTKGQFYGQPTPYPLIRCVIWTSLAGMCVARHFMSPTYQPTPVVQPPKLACSRYLSHWRMILMYVAKKGDFTSEALPLFLGRAHKSPRTVGHSLSQAMEKGGCGSGCKSLAGQQNYTITNQHCGTSWFGIRVQLQASNIRREQSHISGQACTWRQWGI